MVLSPSKDKLESPTFHKHFKGCSEIGKEFFILAAWPFKDNCNYTALLLVTESAKVKVQ